MRAKSLLLSSLISMLISGLLVISGIRIVNVGAESPGVKVFVTPPSFVDPTKGVGTTFTVDINVSDVPPFPAKGLYSFGFRIRWAELVLDAQYAVEGDFLKRGGNYSTDFVMTFFNEENPDSIGQSSYGIISCTLKGEPELSAARGSGTLATIYFIVEAQPGQSAIHIFPQFEEYDYMLWDFDISEIAHTTEDGYFSNVRWKEDLGEPGNVNHPDSYFSTTYTSMGLGTDHNVTGTDVALVARAMGTDSSWTEGVGWNLYNRDCDLNGDNRVDIVDLVIVGVNYGQPR